MLSPGAHSGPDARPTVELDAAISTPKRNGAYYRELVAGWHSKEDVLTWARGMNLACESISDLRRTIGNSLWIREKAVQEIGQDLQALYYAIRMDPRFKEVGGFSAFQKLLGLKTRAPNNIDYAKIVAGWSTKEDVLAWAKSVNIPCATLDEIRRTVGNTEWCARKAEKEIGLNLGPLCYAIRRAPQFKDTGGFIAFQTLLGLDVRTRNRTDYKKIVAGWNSKEDVLAWATSMKIPCGDLTDLKRTIGCSQWLQETSREQFGRTFKPLYNAIVSAPRFREAGGFSAFRCLLGLDVKCTARNEVDYTKIVASWKTKDDVLSWAKTTGIPCASAEDIRRTIGSSEWMQRRAKSQCGLELAPLYKAIRRAPQFKDDGGFSAFQTLLEIQKINYPEVVAAWRTRADVLAWAATLNIPCSNEADIRRTIGSSAWIKKKARNEIGTPIAPLYKAICRAPQFTDNGGFAAFQKLLGLEPTWIPSKNRNKDLRNIFESPEGEVLRAIAEELGSCATAEYLCAKYQNRFAYTSGLVGNLRQYLGDIETTRSHGIESIPVEVFAISELSHLREAQFNHYRDAHYSLFDQGGMDAVSHELRQRAARTEHPEQRAFVEGLLEYYQTIAEIPRPNRLKDTLDGVRAFPAKHQDIAYHELRTHRSLLLGDEMGGGKTGSAVASIERLFEEGKAKRALIVVPAKVIPVWRKALSEGPDGYFRAGSSPKVTIVEPGRSWSEAKHAEYVVMSLEKLRGERAGRSRVQIAREFGADVLVVDEAHNVKSTSGTDAENVFQLSQTPGMRAGHVLLLTGTPVPNTLRDVAAIVRLLYAGRDEPEDLDLGNLKTLSKQLLAAHPLVVRNLLVRRMLRRTAESCLPIRCDAHREVLRCELNPVERTRYEALLSNPFMTAGEKIPALRRTCLLAESKFELLREAVERALGRTKYAEAARPPKILIAESWLTRGVTQAPKGGRPREEAGCETYIAQRLSNEFAERLQVFVLDGDNSGEREEILAAFRSCTGPAILVTNIATVGEGLDLTCAADAVLLSPAYTVSAEAQLFHRIARKGQTLPTHLQVLAFDDSIETGILAYAERKNELVHALVDGRPLTPREQEMLGDDICRVREGGFVAYEVMSPRQKARWILSRMSELGKTETIKFLEADGGRLAKDFAAYYPIDEETSVSGNTARLVAAVIEQLPARPIRKIADIACGCRTLERLFEGHRGFAVASVDINRAALTAGAALMGAPVETIDAEHAPMDALPFANGSKDTAVLSLALDLTVHSPSARRRGAGHERIATLSELNRVLKDGGHAVLTFHEGLFPDEAAFHRFASVLESSFGFRRIAHLTGRASAYNEEENASYAVWLATFEKVAPATPNLSNEELWEGLRFPRRRSRDGGTASRSDSAVATEKSGAFQDEFDIGALRLAYEPRSGHQKALDLVRTTDNDAKKRLNERINTLINEHGGIEKVPEHLFLAIRLEEVRGSSQADRDRYFEALIQRYGTVGRIPFDELAKNSSIIIERGTCKRRGAYVCLAQVPAGATRARGFGTRYFFSEREG